ncbi:MAG: DUF916 and DUF3324 domain-containing protein [Oscillospiraceae bacterium]|nr:DUF916 and DUF3324 domain-containing protein [Oscillospiraceae bacterium]
MRISLVLNFRMLCSYLTALLIVLSTFALITVSAAAIGGGFAVTPIYPENQVPETIGFFDLHVTPGMNQTIAISITNTVSEEVTVSTTTFTPTTNINAIIDYGAPGAPDETLVLDFAKIAVPERELTTLTPGETKELSINISIPDEGFEGIILGVIHTIKSITAKELAEAEETGGIISRYTFALPVRLQISYDEIEPQLLLGEISTRLVNHRAAVVVEIRNPLPRITRYVTGRADVFPYGKRKPTLTKEDIEIEFAPNSVFPMALVDEAGIGLSEGKYTVAVTLEHEGRVWEFIEDFEIQATEAHLINEGALNLQTASDQRLLPDILLWQAIVLIAITIITLVVIVTTIKYIISNRKSDVELNQFLSDTLRARELRSISSNCKDWRKYDD